MRVISSRVLDHKLRVELRELEGGTFEARVIHQRWTSQILISGGGATPRRALEALSEQLQDVAIAILKGHD